MKKVFSLLICSCFILSVLLIPLNAFAKGGSHGGGSKSRSGHVKGGNTHVKGYVKKNGTYVAPHTKTSPDKSKTNNWSSKGNSNPYTGKEGTKDPYK